MRFDGPSIDYEPVTPARRDRARVQEEFVEQEEWPSRDGDGAAENSSAVARSLRHRPAPPAPSGEERVLRRGHVLSYAVLFLYIVFIYFRPYEMFDSLAWMMPIVFWLGLATLVVFIPSQLVAEGTLTARPREVNLVLLLCLAGLLSIPFANDPSLAWEEFNWVFVKAILMFVVMVNAVRTPRRLKALLLLAISVGCVISVDAVNKYRLGQFDPNDEIGRVVGNIGGMFGNQNDMALHLVTMLPIVIALLLTTRNVIAKAVYAACALVMLMGNFVTFSRGAFLGLVASGAVMTWKLSRRNFPLAIAFIVVTAAASLVVMPGSYGSRVASILNPSGDASGFTRKQLLFDSIYVSLRHPLLGVGMGNSRSMLTRGQVSHNAYTQVASEMGLAAFTIYVMFMVTALKRLRQIERETFATRHGSRFYYLSIGLQVSLVCYMVTSFFLSVAYQWNVYFLVGYAVCFHRIYQSGLAAAAGTKAADAKGEARLSGDGETIRESSLAAAS